MAEKPARKGRSAKRPATNRRVVQVGLDTPEKRRAALRYMDTLSEMNSDPVISERIKRFRAQYAR